MKNRVLLVALGIAVLRVPAAFGEEDPSSKLAAAKAKYDSEIEKARSAALAWLDRREEVARKDGDKPLVDRIKTERDSFKEKLELAADCPSMIRKQFSDARTAMEAAYGVAIKEYTRGKRDDDAVAVERELESFRRKTPVLAPFDGADARNLWMHAHGYFVRGVGKDWFEKWDDGKSPPNLFEEVQKTKDFVELHHRQGRVTYRLYQGRVMLKGDSDGSFRQIYLGKWETSPR